MIVSESLPIFGGKDEKVAVEVDSYITRNDSPTSLHVETDIPLEFDESVATNHSCKTRNTANDEFERVSNMKKSRKFISQRPVHPVSERQQLKLLAMEQEMIEEKNVALIAVTSELPIIPTVRPIKTNKSTTPKKSPKKSIEKGSTKSNVKSLAEKQPRKRGRPRTVNIAASNVNDTLDPSASKPISKSTSAGETCPSGDASNIPVASKSLNSSKRGRGRGRSASTPRSRKPNIKTAPIPLDAKNGNNSANCESQEDIKVINNNADNFNPSYNIPIEKKKTPKARGKNLKPRITGKMKKTASELPSKANNKVPLDSVKISPLKDGTHVAHDRDACIDPLPTGQLPEADVPISEAPLVPYAKISPESPQNCNIQPISDNSSNGVIALPNEHTERFELVVEEAILGTNNTQNNVLATDISDSIDFGAERVVLHPSENDTHFKNQPEKNVENRDKIDVDFVPVELRIERLGIKSPVEKQISNSDFNNILEEKESTNSNGNIDSTNHGNMAVEFENEKKEFKPSKQDINLYLNDIRIEPASKNIAAMNESPHRKQDQTLNTCGGKLKKAINRKFACSKDKTSPKQVRKKRLRKVGEDNDTPLSPPLSLSPVFEKTLEKVDKKKKSGDKGSRKGKQLKSIMNDEDDDDSNPPKISKKHSKSYTENKLREESHIEDKTRVYLHSSMSTTLIDSSQEKVIGYKTRENLHAPSSSNRPKSNIPMYSNRIDSNSSSNWDRKPELQFESWESTFEMRLKECKNLQRARMYRLSQGPPPVNSRIGSISDMVSDCQPEFTPKHSDGSIMMDPKVPMLMEELPFGQSEKPLTWWGVLPIPEKPY